MAVSKVILDGSTLLDVTNSTVNSQRILSGYTAKGADGVDVTGAYVPPTFDTQVKSVTPSESQQTVTPDSGYDGLSSVTVGAISSTYVGSGITRRSSSDLTASGATVTVPAGYYQSQASKAVASGSAGTPTATKGSVSNHAVSVTPSVTNTAGYITGGTVSGTAVSVSASELVSGTLNVTQNGTVDVTNYASASVNVQGGEDVNYARTVSRSGAITSIPNVTSIGDYAYSGCAGLSVSSLPSGLTSIGPYAFQDCTGLTISALPSGLASIGNGAFNNSGITIDTIPSSVTSIGTSAFANCKSIEEIEIPSGISSIGASTFSACWNLASVTIPSTVTSIGQNAFFQCVSLTDVTALGTITSIGTNAFTTNTNTSTTMQLAHVALPNATISSLSTAFGSTTAYNACQNLESADLGKTSAIAANAFANCYKLQTLVLRKTSVCTLSNVSGLLNTPMRGYNGLTGTVYVPSSLVATYKTATNWSTLYNNGTVTFSAIEGSVWEL